MSKQSHTLGEKQHKDYMQDGDCCTTKVCPRCASASYVSGVQPPNSPQIIRCDNCGRTSTPSQWGDAQAADTQKSPDYMRRTQ